MNDGSQPAEFVDPRTFTGLPEVGIRSKGRANPAEASPGIAFDLAENVCDSAAEDCPVRPGKGKRVHAGFPGPAAAGGLDGLRNVRDAIAWERIPPLEKYEN